MTPEKGDGKMERQIRHGEKEIEFDGWKYMVTPLGTEYVVTPFDGDGIDDEAGFYNDDLGRAVEASSYEDAVLKFNQK